jgi:hypothetical protein
MTDFERLVVSWDLWVRRSRALALGMRLGPLMLGVVVGGGWVAAEAVPPMLV